MVLLIRSCVILTSVVVWNETYLTKIFFNRIFYPVKMSQIRIFPNPRICGSNLHYPDPNYTIRTRHIYACLRDPGIIRCIGSDFKIGGCYLLSDLLSLSISYLHLPKNREQIYTEWVRSKRIFSLTNTVKRICNNISTI